ncbi:hypothetical protein ZMTM_11160 [Methyloradius palustris]|uniref:Uncharacterized protein n=2 Tax=Methyloradius palustris TaxID=2778876 RepID=A0A8D5FZ98_9PROT|nr:hypothetical protein ZMTM_11160 [Methyloradius palustris]
MGPPGIVTHLHVVPVFQDDRKNDEKRFRDKTSRNFRVTARLAKSNESQPSINFNFEEGSGDSLFSIPENVAYLKVETFDGKFLFYPNSERRLSTVKFECTAQSAEEARRLFHRIVGPALDHLAYVANTPLHVVQISVVDELHQISSTDILCPYPLASLNQGLGKVYGLLVPVYAMYREAVNATSPFYKFFCFYKILEGLLKTLPGRLHTEAKIKNISLPPLKAKVPHYKDIPTDQKQYEGKSITRFFDEFLTNRFRNSIAHFISDEGSALNVNEVEEMERYSSVVHVADICCRELISHFEKCIEVLEKPHE